MFSRHGRQLVYVDFLLLVCASSNEEVQKNSKAPESNSKAAEKWILTVRAQKSFHIGTLNVRNKHSRDTGNTNKEDRISNDTG